MKLNGQIVLAGLVIVATIMTGCASSSNNTKNQAQTQSTTYHQAPGARTSLAHDYHAYTGGIKTRNYQNSYTINDFHQDLAEQLTKAADDVPGVERAVSLVSGNDAIIGIRVRNNFAPEQVRVIEQQVHAAARSRVPNFSIKVASDAGTFDRLRAIRSDIYEEATQRTRSNQMTNASTEFRALLNDLSRKIPSVTP
ncbi:YhcN/YlaJ family sporulation lipoprotein [Brevibacillus sp. 179-C9.3 HS]|uniref:YhcN/YlaJ family sporulation lipoprotein n=1 Tax=unclassified Brevibacillus TaxID=2684853 RepID=UPI0039A28E32